MHYHYSRSLRIISAILVFLHAWVFAGGYSTAYAIKSDQQAANSTQQGQGDITPPNHHMPQGEGKKPEEKLGKDMEDIENILKDDKSDHETKKQKIKTKKADIDADDIEIKKQFKDTEEKIKHLPGEIWKRHQDFVKKYDDNLTTLKTDLDDIENAKTDKEKELAQKKAKDFIEKVKPPRKHQKLDPNKLPHRTEEPVFKEPRTKPEEFLKDSQKSIVRSQKSKPILVAANGSLKGILSPNTEYTNELPSSSFPDLIGESRKALDARLHTAGMTTVSGGLPEGSYQIALANPPTTADLAETIEVQFTPAIKAKAQALGNNPVKIYNWVRNNIEYVPTYGSIQGADMCLQTKQCNDFDTASLLIALLRVSGIHAHYVYGTIEVPIEKVKNRVGGFTDTNAALTLIASGSIPITGLTSAGQVTAARMEHVWVEAWIDYIPSRGSVNKQGDTWIPLDASFKEFTYKKGIDVKSITGFNPQSFLDNITAASTIDPVTGAVKNLPVSTIQSQMTSMVNTLSSYIDTTMPNATVGDVFGAKNIVQHNYRILPASLPYNVVATGNKLSEVPDSLRHKVTVTIEDPYGITPPLSHSASLPQLVSKRITLAYMPLTSSDAQVLATYGHFSAPPYLVRLKAVLYLDGVAVAESGDIGMGETQNLTVSFSQPGRGSDSVTHTITASSFASIGLDMQRIPLELLTQRKAKLDQTLAQLGQQNVAVDDVIGEILNLHSLAYFYQVEIVNRLATQGKIAYAKKTSEMLTTLSPNIAYLYGMPYSISGQGMNVDVKRQIMAAISLTGDVNEQKTFMLMTGQNSSAMEHTIFEEFSQGAQGVSAVKIISEAAKQGISIYEITSNNIGNIMPKLQISPEAVDDIRNAVAAGKKVYVPERSLQYYNWHGDGYIIINPTTGGGAYMIAGGLAGGALAFAGSNLPTTISRLLQSISFGILREAFREIAAANPEFSSAVNTLRLWAGPIGALITGVFAGINMWFDTHNTWKGIAAGLGTFGLVILAWAFLGWILPIIAVVGAAAIVLTIAFVVILSFLLQTILMDYIRTAGNTYFRLRDRYYVRVIFDGVNNGA